MILLRQGILLENVGALLSSQTETRKLFRYILKAWFCLIHCSLHLFAKCVVFAERIWLSQECAKRDLRARWCTVSLTNVGLPALASGGGLSFFVAKGCSVSFRQAGRKRVFILCAVKSFRFPD